MANGTVRVSLGQSKTWTQIDGGNPTLVIALLQGTAEFFYGPTASAPTADSLGMPLYMFEVPWTFNVDASNGLWARSADFAELAVIRAGL